ncbi:hypothetical protein [Aquimarina algiphila]|uniref:hypothetical protein n=1 Tax=Aquimarina algiphila TaxID=2047982 RepID=UPI002330FBF2|nr:hypothetical protein [Aquimarina algiphila]
MNDKLTQDLVKKSMIHTSDDFTDLLMNKIEEKNKQEIKVVFPVKKLLFGIATSLIIISFGAFKLLASSYHLFSLDIRISKMPVLITIVLLFLLGMYYILRMNEVYRGLKNEI